MFPRTLLMPLSVMYRFAARRDRKRKLARRFVSRLPVISVGNITVGGSGKTPLVELLINRLQPDVSVLVLSRGYGRRGRKDVIWHAGEQWPDPANFGDEPGLFTRLISNGAVGVAEDRAGFLERCEDTFAGSVVLLDDGFQHHRLHRDLDLVIVDDRTAASRRLIPAGDLREPLTELRRADILLATTPEAEHCAYKWRSNGSQVLSMNLTGTGIHRADYAEPLPADKRYVLVTGVARSGRVLKSVEQIASRAPEAAIHFADHHDYSIADVQRILKALHLNDATAVVTTAKDAVKLQRFEDMRDRLYVVDYHAHVPEIAGVLDRIREVINNKQQRE